MGGDGYLREDEGALAETWRARAGGASRRRRAHWRGLAARRSCGFVPERKVLLGHVGLLPIESSAHEFRCSRHSLESPPAIVDNCRRKFKYSNKDGISRRGRSSVSNMRFPHSIEDRSSRGPTGVGPGWSDSPGATSVFPRTWKVILVFLISLGVYHANLRDNSGVDVVPPGYVAWSLIHEGNFDLTEHLSSFGYMGEYVIPMGLVKRGAFGDWISKVPPGSAIMAVPFYGVLSLVSKEMPEVTRMLAVGKTAAATYCALATAIFFIIAARIVPGAAVWSTVLFGFGTTVWSTASQALWTHGPTVFWLSVALLVLTTEQVSRGWLGVVAGFALGMAVVCRPTEAVLLVGLCGWLMISKNRGLAIRVGLGSILPVGLLTLYNAYYTGSLVAGGYGADASRWSMPLWIGLAGLTVAPSRGLLFYTPAVVVALFGAIKLFSRGSWLSPIRRNVLIGASLGAGLTVIMYAKWFAWWGGWSYGPRHLTEITLIVSLLFGIGYLYLPSARARRLAVILVWLSVAIHFVGVFGHDDWYTWSKRHYQEPYGADLFQVRDTQISWFVHRLMHPEE